MTVLTITISLQEIQTAVDQGELTIEIDKVTITHDQLIFERTGTTEYTYYAAFDGVVVDAKSMMYVIPIISKRIEEHNK